MPMNAIGEYIYFLFVTSLFGAPLVLLLFMLAWRRGQLRRALIAVVLTLPIIAIVLQIGYNSSAVLEGREYDAMQTAIETRLRSEKLDRVFDGYFLGVTDLRPGVPAKRYLYPLPEEFGDGSIEVWLPIEQANNPGLIVLSSTVTVTKDKGSPARLLLQPPTRSLNPARDPERYFSDFHPTINRNALGHHTLIAQLRPRSSVIIHPYTPARAKEWRYNPVELRIE